MTDSKYEFHKEAQHLFAAMAELIDDERAVVVWQALAQILVATDITANIENGNYSAFDQYLKFLAELRKSRIADIYGEDFLKDENSIDTVFT